MNKYDDTDYQIEREESIEYKENDIMSEEAFNELIDNFEVVKTLTESGRKAIKQNVKKLQKRIQDLESKLKEANKQLDYVDKNYIPVEKVKEGLEYIENYFDRLNGPDEDIEYIRKIKTELLEDK